MSTLSTVQERHPEIKTLFPAKSALSVPVRTKHRKGAKANPWDCTVSRAVKELLGVDDVCTLRSSVVVISDGRAVQYEHGSGSRELVTINDHRGEVVDQTVWLNAPNQKQQLLSLLRGKKDGIQKKELDSIIAETAARINELRNQGYDIASKRGCDGRVTYSLVSEPKTIKPSKKYAPRIERKYRRVEKAELLRNRA